MVIANVQAAVGGMQLDRGTDGAAGALSRRSILLGLSAFAAAASMPAAAAEGEWELATQILAGTRLRDPTVLALTVARLTEEVGEAGVARLVGAVLARDAADIVQPFEDPAVESAARRFVEMAYTGEIGAGPGQGPAIAFHQALAWQVLRFTKPPSVCGPGFGWWTLPPDREGGR